MQWFFYFMFYVQAAQPVPSTKVQPSSVTANTILKTCHFTGGLYTGPRDMPLECDNNNYYWYAIDTIDGNVMCLTLAPRKPLQSLGLLWQYLLIALDILWHVNLLILFNLLLELVILNTRKVIWNLGETFSAVLHFM